MHTHGLDIIQSESDSSVVFFNREQFRQLNPTIEQEADPQSPTHLPRTSMLGPLGLLLGLIVGNVLFWGALYALITRLTRHAGAVIAWAGSYL